MNNVIEIFKEITSIPRCSGTHQPFIDYIKKFAKKYGYDCFIDNYYNILCKKSNSKAKLCIQNHYDIVCLVDNCIPKIIEEEGFLKAQNSTLGADNGIGCSYMLDLMTENYDIEFLFTADEEIGLIGANNLEHNLNTKYMLNIDSEEEAKVCIGCAGGIDILGKNYKKSIIENNDNYKLYELNICDLPGGHSGINIHLNTPNAIKLIAKTIKDNNGLILEINGGERKNSIPVKTKAIVAFKSYPKKIAHENISIKEINAESKHLNIWDDDICDFIYTFANGVRGYDEEVEVVLTSINLAKITTTVDSIDIELSGRSMDNKELTNLKEETCLALERFGFEVETNGKYPAWKPNINDFTDKVLKIYKKYEPRTSYEAIHAGLECAIFKDKFSHMQITSVGPNIFDPHSNREKVEIQSINKLSKIIKEIADIY